MRRSPSCESNFELSQHEQIKSGNQQLNFIQKAYDLVNNSKNSEIIHWSRSGLTFIIQDIQRFERQLLPLYFRHNSYQSFVRQLNMYDFHKIRNGDYYCDNKSQFRHEEFSRGNYQAISLIRRKGFQAKNKQKQNTKLKKGNRGVSKKNMKRRRTNILKILPQKMQVQPIVEPDQNSFFLEIPKQAQNSLTATKGQVRSKIYDKITTDSVEHFLKCGIQIFYKTNKLNQAIDLAEQIKQKWLENIDKVQGPQDIHDLKEIYYFVKEQLILRISHLNNFDQGNNSNKDIERQFDEQFDQIGQEEDAIIESIFKAEIRSTLICITSQTFLHNNNNQRRYDTLIGL